MSPRLVSSSPASPCARSPAAGSCGSSSCSPSRASCSSGWGVGPARDARPRGGRRRAPGPDRRVAGPDPHRVHVQLRARDVGGVPRGAGDRLRTSRPARSTRCSPGRCAGRSSSSGAGWGCRSSSRPTRRLSGLLAIAVVGLVSGHVPPEPLVAVGFLAFQSIAVLTLALTLGTRLPSIAAGAITVVLFGLGWFAGVLGSIAIAFEAARARRRERGAAGRSSPRTACGGASSTAWSRRVVLLMAAGRSARGDGREPVLRRGASAGGVRRLERRLGRAGPGRGDRAVPPPRALSVRPSPPAAGAPSSPCAQRQGMGFVSNRFDRSGSADDGLVAL